MKLIAALITIVLTIPASAQFKFAVSGDSRNCGDVVMPLIAADAAKQHAKFYWHLGDLRWGGNIDQDMQLRADRRQKLDLAQYTVAAWPDFIQNQIGPFGDMPFFVGIGNHELYGGHTRNDFLIQFADWLASSPLRDQRLQDDPSDHRLKTYFHWIQNGVDFIYLDNASIDQFDKAQLNWFQQVTERAANNKSVKAIVVGMHRALPDSLSSGHSMSDDPQMAISGRAAYRRLVEIHSRSKKPVFILASHSHFFMQNIFNTEAKRKDNTVLPGWIVGTAGAMRYVLPPTYKQADAAQTNVYGYLLGTVQHDGEIKFEFREVKESDVKPDMRTKLGPELMNYCFNDNKEK